MENALVVNTQCARRAVGEDTSLFDISRCRRHVGSRCDLRGSQLDGCVLRKVEDFDEVQLRAEDMIRVMMPALSFKGTLRGMMGDEDGQTDL